MATWSPTFVLLTATCALIFCILSVSVESSLQPKAKTARSINMNTIQDMLETKCKSKQHPLTYTLIKNSIKTSNICLNRKISKDNFKDTFCSESRLGLYNCYGRILGNFELCMELTEKYFPKFLFDILDVTLDNICLHKNNATEFSSDIRLFQATLNTLVHQDLLQNCVSRFRVFWDIGEPVPLLAKNTMCEGLEKLGQCLVFVAKQKGDGYQSIANFINAMFYKYQKLCENHLPIND